MGRWAADLGVGGFRVGHVPGEPYIAAGDDAVFQVPCRDDGTATLFLLLHGADGTNLRFAEAWVC